MIKQALKAMSARSARSANVAVLLATAACAGTPHAAARPAQQAVAHNAAPLPTTEPIAQVLQRMRLSAGAFADVAVESAADATRVAVSLNDQPTTLELHPVSLRAPGFKLLVQEAGGQLVELAAPPPRTFKGIVVGQPASSVAATVDGERVTALIRLEDDEVWVVQPVRRQAAPASDAAHLVFRAADTIPGGFTCGADDLPQPALPADAPGPDGGGSGGPTRGGFVAAKLAIDADVEFFQANGSSVVDTINDIESVMNGVRSIYEPQVSIAHVISTIVVRTAESDPYGSADANLLLCQFRNRWNTGPELAFQRDAAHLFTGKDLVGNTIGLAWVGTMCRGNFTTMACADGSLQDLAYGLSESRFSGSFNERVSLTAHELGHNWSARHCNQAASGNCNNNAACGIMCSSVGDCGGSLLNFEQCTRDVITAFRDNSPCLVGWPPAELYVDWRNGGSEDGSPSNPFNTVGEAAQASLPGGWIFIADGGYPGAVTINKSLWIYAPRGGVTVGR